MVTAATSRRKSRWRRRRPSSSWHFTRLWSAPGRASHSTGPARGKGRPLVVGRFSNLPRRLSQMALKGVGRTLPGSLHMSDGRGWRAVDRQIHRDRTAASIRVYREGARRGAGGILVIAADVEAHAAGIIFSRAVIGNV